jgi:hypothetical protein
MLSQLYHKLAFLLGLTARALVPGVYPGTIGLVAVFFVQEVSADFSHVSVQVCTPRRPNPCRLGVSQARTLRWTLVTATRRAAEVR